MIVARETMGGMAKGLLEQVRMALAARAAIPSRAIHLGPTA